MALRHQHMTTVYAVVETAVDVMKSDWDDETGQREKGLSEGLASTKQLEITQVRGKKRFIRLSANLAVILNGDWRLNVFPISRQFHVFRTVIN